ncbi:hypothetical protein GCM10009775_05700 [Microbacterium aoyamense]|uniref:Uncharacterized protein n=1 Tax=Microbacterium aoyamense TaxID=344166 RepID=A0ABN2PC68_9MICO
MTEVRILDSPEQLHSFSVVGSRLAMITVAEHVLDLMLQFEDASATTIRIESAAEVIAPGVEPATYQAGPDLARALLSSTGDDVTDQRAEGLDLALVLGRGQNSASLLTTRATSPMS